MYDKSSIKQYITVTGKIKHLGISCISTLLNMEIFKYFVITFVTIFVYCDIIYVFVQAVLLFLFFKTRNI